MYSQNWQFIKGRLYEITHQYQGVLDFHIPYLKDHFKNTDQLIIATNYEETSYIYYLNCRVIVGFVNPDFRPDRLEQPDCIIYRSYWSDVTDKNVFSALLKQDKYKYVRFHVTDYGFNNIPETVHWTVETGWNWHPHLFKTSYSDIKMQQSTIFIRNDIASNGPRVLKNGL